MTFATDFAASVAALKASLSGTGLTADQVDAHIHAVVDPLAAQITTITAGQADDASKIADITTALQAFESAFPGAPATSSGSGASAGTVPGSTPAV